MADYIDEDDYSEFGFWLDWTWRLSEAIEQAEAGTYEIEWPDSIAA
jgi:hypothetical protein